MDNFWSYSRELEDMVSNVFPSNTSSISRTKVLGVTWDKKKVNIVFTLKDLFHLTKSTPTKIEVLSFIASIYDPLGLINPFFMKLKVLFQNVCISGVKWDELIDGDCLDK